MSTKTQFILFVLLLSIYMLISCGDIGATCIQDDDREICYYASEFKETDIKNILSVINTKFPFYKNDIKVTREHKNTWFIFLEINTSVEKSTQKAFLQLFADSISHYCHQNKSVEVTGVSVIDCVGCKGNNEIAKSKY